MVQDITERKQLEEQFRQSQKMEAVGQLAGGVAHDFNNLLTGITGFTKLLLRDAEEGTCVHDDLTQIDELGRRAADLTRQLLAFSRRQPLAAVVVNINGLIHDISKMLNRLIGEHIDLAFLPAEHLWTTQVDPGQLEQVLMNLAVNARDAMPDGGKLTIETANVTLDSEYARMHVGAQAGPHVMIAVSDTGAGMDEKTQSRIFEPFFTTKELGKGTGLGLSTVYGIVKQHGGNVWVYSEVGKGTTFKIYLPRAQGEAVAAERETAESEVPRGSETILLVEDEGAVRDIAVRTLEEAGYSVLSASSPESADPLFDEHRDEIAMLLTDVVLPGCSGPELWKRLSAQRESLPVLYMSGYTDHAMVRNGHLSPNAPFLQKPFDPDVLAKRVRQVLDG